MNSTAVPCALHAARIRSSTLRCMITSSAVVGSSATRRAGRCAMAMARHARWAMPPDSSQGWARRIRSASGSPTSASSPRSISSRASRGIARGAASRSCVPSEQVAAPEQDAPRDAAVGGGGQAREGHGADALAAAAFPDQGVEPALRNPERNASNDLDRLSAARKGQGDPQVFDLQERGGGVFVVGHAAEYTRPGPRAQAAAAQTGCPGLLARAPEVWYTFLIHGRNGRKA